MECFTTQLATLCYEILVSFAEHYTKAEYIRGTFSYLCISGRLHGCATVSARTDAAGVHGQGRGGSTGYDNAVALPARSDSDELAKENNKSVAALKGQAVFSVAKVRATQLAID